MHPFTLMFVWLQSKKNKNNKEDTNMDMGAAVAEEEEDGGEGLHEERDVPSADAEEEGDEVGRFVVLWVTPHVHESRL
jgi:hypothetical protein